MYRLHLFPVLWLGDSLAPLSEGGMTRKHNVTSFNPVERIKSSVNFSDLCTNERQAMQGYRLSDAESRIPYIYMFESFNRIFT
jgi:hypothetical protein